MVSVLLMIMMSSQSEGQGAFQLGSPTLSRVTETEHYYYNVRDYSPPVPVSPSVNEKQANLRTPEEAALAHFSAMLAGNYRAWLDLWDDEARTEMLARNAKRGRDAEYWRKRWQAGLKSYSAFELTRRVDTGPFVIIEFRASKAKNSSENLFLDVSLRLVDNKEWRPTQALADDVVANYWRRPDYNLERIGRMPPK